jgi:hypothetical protein
MPQRNVPQLRQEMEKLIVRVEAILSRLAAIEPPKKKKAGQS